VNAAQPFSPGDRGFQLGTSLQGPIAANLREFGTAIRVAGWDEGILARATSRLAAYLRPSRLEEIEGMADGAGVPHASLLAFNLLGPLFAPDECTVAMAVGRAGATGSTVFMKNSDKIGSGSLVGEHFYRHKEINVVVDLRSDSGHRIVGVAAAGSTGLKMAVNDAGVVAGSNISRTMELKKRRVNITQLRALDRGQILRDGLEHERAEGAARWAAAAMIENPTDTPGNVEFADAGAAFVIEGSYEHWAVEEVRDRSNMFVLLDRLNDPADVSSQSRYARVREVLQSLEGPVEADHLKRLSQDHVNGPGLNSVCRHSADYRDETSLSAMVVVLDREDPSRSEVAIALGKPCAAWNDPEGVLAMTMADPPSSIPDRFRNGETWRRLYVEDVRAV